MFLVSASEAFFDNLTVEQEFMTGVDTDKVLLIYLKEKNNLNNEWKWKILALACTLVLINIITIQVNTYIEDSIAQKDPLIKILRLVCMQSVCNNGLKQKVFDYYKREILQVESKT